MNVCGVDRLKLTPNVSNEFIFTIKENGKLTPMPISVNGQVLTLETKEYTQNSIRSSATESSAVINKVVEVGFPYAFILGQSTVVKSATAPDTNLRSGSLWQNTVNNTLYVYGGLVPYNANDWTIAKTEINLKTSRLTTNLNYLVDTQELPMLDRIKTWAIGLGYTCSISGNKLQIAKAEDFTYTNTSNLSARVIQDYAAAVVGTATQYMMTETTIDIDLSFISNNLTTNVICTFSFPVSVNGGSLTSSYTLVKSGGVYPSSITVRMPATTVASSTIRKLTATFTTTSTGTDTFVFKFIRLSDNTTVDLTKTPTIESAVDGKLKLVVSSAEVNSLISSLGTQVDNYYLKYTYRLLLEATTRVNGNFIAEIRKVAIG